MSLSPLRLGERVWHLCRQKLGDFKLLMDPSWLDDFMRHHFLHNVVL